MYARIWIIDFVLMLILMPYYACSQTNHSHPKCENAAYDKMLEKLLNFSVPLISCQDLKKNKSTYLLLDAREWKEYEVSHIPGAQFTGFDNFNTSNLRSIDKNTPIVVYCSVGYRSEKIAEKLIAAGFTNVKNLYGSIFEWANLGYPLEDNSKRMVNKLHAYNKEWSKWVKGGAIQIVF